MPLAEKRYEERFADSVPALIKRVKARFLTRLYYATINFSCSIWKMAPRLAWDTCANDAALGAYLTQ